jgi:hypothetical protein
VGSGGLGATTNHVRRPQRGSLPSFFFPCFFLFLKFHFGAREGEFSSRWLLLLRVTLHFLIWAHRYHMNLVSLTLVHDEVDSMKSTLEICTGIPSRSKLLRYIWCAYMVRTGCQRCDIRELDVMKACLLYCRAGFFFLAAKYGGRTCGWCI